MKDVETDAYTGTDLITIPHKTEVAANFSKPGWIEGQLTRIEKDARALAKGVDAAALKTLKGRKELKSIAARVSRSKTLIDEVGKEQNEQANLVIKANNALRNLTTKRMDALRDEIKAPALAAEAAEAERVRLHMVAMDAFGLDRVDGNCDSAEIAGVIATIEAVEVGPSWEEYEADAKAAKAAALVKFRSDLGVAQAREAQAAELEALRAEKAKRDQEDAERAAKEAAAQAEKERAEREAEMKARAAAEANEKAKQAAAAAEARHKAELAEAERRAEFAAQEERNRQARIKAAEEEAAAKRAADKKHRQKIRAEVVASITELKPGNWEELVDAMIWGKVAHVKVEI